MEDDQRTTGKQPFYEKWWIWAITGIAVIALFCTLTLGSLDRGNASPIVGVPIEQPASSDTEQMTVPGEDNPAEYVTREPNALLSGDKTKAYVYVTEAGKRFHLSPACSGMKEPEEITLAEAEDSGYTACKKCCK